MTTRVVDGGERDDRLQELYAHNDEIERLIARINKHGRREEFSDEETQRKADLMAELNDVIDEIQRLELRRSNEKRFK